MSRKFCVTLSPPHLGDNRADAPRLLAALPVNGEVAIPLAVLRRISEPLRTGGWQVTAAICRTKCGWRLQDVEPGDTTARHFGLAVDVGTTTVAVAVVDLNTRKKVAVATAENRQVSVAEDILTRLWVAAEPDGRAMLQGHITETINKVTATAAAEAGVRPQEITAVAVSANTGMVHLLLGLDPSRICCEPYIPVVTAPDLLRAQDLGLVAHPEAVVYFLPGVSSYVGGDAIGGVLISGLHRQEEVGLFVDIGTNGEMVLGNREWLVAAAGAAGPAFEGGVVAQGMRALPGAINRVRIDPDTQRVTYKVIGGEKPRGICGSGVVDALAGMLLSGIIDQSGRFRDGREAFLVAPGSETATGRDIIITQRDIKNFLRTKGAVNAAIETLLAAVGLKPHEIARFYAAGAFGEHLDVESAVIIGLYPDLPRDRIVVLGNTALAAAAQALLYDEAREELVNIARQVTYVELNANADFMARFAGSQFFPHTDILLYPTVAEKLRAAGLLKK